MEFIRVSACRRPMGTQLLLSASSSSSATAENPLIQYLVSFTPAQQKILKNLNKSAYFVPKTNLVHTCKTYANKMCMGVPRLKTACSRSQSSHALTLCRHCDPCVRPNLSKLPRGSVSSNSSNFPANPLLSASFPVSIPIPKKCAYRAYALVAASRGGRAQAPTRFNDSTFQRFNAAAQILLGTVQMDWPVKLDGFPRRVQDFGRNEIGLEG